MSFLKEGLHLFKGIYFMDFNTALFRTFKQLLGPLEEFKKRDKIYKEGEQKMAETRSTSISRYCTLFLPFSQPSQAFWDLVAISFRFLPFFAALNIWKEVHKLLLTKHFSQKSDNTDEPLPNINENEDRHSTDTRSARSPSSGSFKSSLKLYGRKAVEYVEVHTRAPSPTKTVTKSTAEPKNLNTTR